MGLRAAIITFFFCWASQQISAEIPIIAFGVVLFSIAFGMMSGRLKTYADILQALSFGIAKGAPLLVLLLLLLQFYASLRFVFT